MIIKLSQLCHLLLTYNSVFGKLGWQAIPSDMAVCCNVFAKMRARTDMLTELGLDVTRG